MRTKLLVDFVGIHVHLHIHLNNFFNSIKVCSWTQYFTYEVQVNCFDYFTYTVKDLQNNRVFKNHLAYKRCLFSLGLISNSCSYIIIVNIISPPFPPHIRRNQMTIYYSCVEYIKDTCFQNKRDLFMWIIINNLIITCLYQEIHSFLMDGKSICFHE